MEYIGIIVMGLAGLIEDKIWSRTVLIVGIILYVNAKMIV